MCCPPLTQVSPCQPWHLLARALGRDPSDDAAGPLVMHLVGHCPPSRLTNLLPRLIERACRCGPADLLVAVEHAADAADAAERTLRSFDEALVTVAARCPSDAAAAVAALVRRFAVSLPQAAPPSAPAPLRSAAPSVWLELAAGGALQLRARAARATAAASTVGRAAALLPHLVLQIEWALGRSSWPEQAASLARLWDAAGALHIQERVRDTLRTLAKGPANHASAACWRLERSVVAQEWLAAVVRRDAAASRAAAGGGITDSSARDAGGSSGGGSSAGCKGGAKAAPSPAACDQGSPRDAHAAACSNSSGSGGSDQSRHGAVAGAAGASTSIDGDGGGAVCGDGPTCPSFEVLVAEALTPSAARRKFDEAAAVLAAAGRVDLLASLEAARQEAAGLAPAAPGTGAGQQAQLQAPLVPQPPRSTWPYPTCEQMSAVTTAAARADQPEALVHLLAHAARFSHSEKFSVMRAALCAAVEAGALRAVKALSSSRLCTQEVLWACDDVVLGSCSMWEPLFLAALGIGGRTAPISAERAAAAAAILLRRGVSTTAAAAPADGQQQQEPQPQPQAHPQQQQGGAAAAEAAMAAAAAEVEASLLLSRWLSNPRAGDPASSPYVIALLEQGG